MNKPSEFLIVLFILLYSCSLNDQSAAKRNDNKYHKLQQLEWMIGNWADLSDDGSFFEIWDRMSDSVFSANSYLIINEDTVFAEQVSLEFRGNDLFYIVSVEDQNNDQPVSFKLISNENGEFIFENKEHDFPQRVIYKNPSPDSLYAKIEGTINGKFSVQEFPMKRIADINPLE